MKWRLCPHPINRKFNQLNQPLKPALMKFQNKLSESYRLPKPAPILRKIFVEKMYLTPTKRTDLLNFLIIISPLPPRVGYYPSISVDILTLLRSTFAPSKSSSFSLRLPVVTCDFVHITVAGAVEDLNLFPYVPIDFTTIFYRHWHGRLYLCQNLV